MFFFVFKTIFTIYNDISYFIFISFYLFLFIYLYVLKKHIYKFDFIFMQYLEKYVIYNLLVYIWQQDYIITNIFYFPAQ